MMNVSRTTIRSALQGLEQHGIVSRKRAVGTTIRGHIRPSALALQRLVGFDTLLQERGYRVRSEVSLERTTPSQGMMEVFELASDCDCLIASTRYFAGEQVAIAVRDIVPRETLTTESFEEPHRQVRLSPGLYVCGDYRENGSIEGAMVSGRRAAEALLRDRDLD